jgi:hypothetical protein
VTHITLGITLEWIDGTAVGNCSFIIHVRRVSAAIAANRARWC